MTLHPTIPIEVLEETIGQASDNTESLRCLSLTCSAFLSRARCHLFTGIQIDTMEQLESSDEFLDSRPWLAPLIRRVTLRIQILFGRKSWPFVVNVVPVHLLSRLPNLRSWSMACRSNEARLPFHRLTLSCYRRYSAGIQHLEVSDITLKGNISDFTRLISAFHTIQSLSYSCIILWSSNEHSPSMDGLDATTIRTAQTVRINTLRVSLTIISHQLVRKC